MNVFLSEGKCLDSVRKCLLDPGGGAPDRHLEVCEMSHPQSVTMTMIPHEAKGLSEALFKKAQILSLMFNTLVIK